MSEYLPHTIAVDGIYALRRAIPHTARCGAFHISPLRGWRITPYLNCITCSIKNTRRGLAGRVGRGEWDLSEDEPTFVGFLGRTDTLNLVEELGLGRGHLVEIAVFGWEAYHRHRASTQESALIHYILWLDKHIGTGVLKHTGLGILLDGRD